MARDVFWCGQIPERDDFGFLIRDEFVDGRTLHGVWGFMAAGNSFATNNGTNGKLGTGLGQRYRKQADGRWKKVEG